MNLDKFYQATFSPQLDTQEWNMGLSKPKAKFWTKKVNTIHHFYILLTLDIIFLRCFSYAMSS